MTFFDSIRSEANKKPQQEVCGLLYELGHSVLAHPANNVSDFPNKEFEIAPNDYSTASKLGKVVGYYHSHTSEATVTGFSDKDRVIANSVRLRAYLYDLPKDQFHLFSPLDAIHALDGRKFVLGYHDCVSYVSDYYAIRNRTPVSPVPMVSRDLHSLRNGFPYTKRLLLEAGFKQVDRTHTPQGGDLLLFKISSEHVNHMGIYIDPLTLGHQPLSGISGQVALQSYLDNLVDVLRPPSGV